ncbi:putative UbiX-like flavin prenyltransferase [Streptomyces violarus]
MRLIVGMTGATGAAFGVRLLENLRELPEVETHLVLTRWARTTIELETGLSVADVSALADVTHHPEDQGATISSGVLHDRRHGDRALLDEDTGRHPARYLRRGLVGRAADVVLKERRKLVLVPRETPLSEIHLENMLALTRLGAQMVPPMPAFYNHPASVDDIVDHITARVLDQFELPARRQALEGMRAARALRTAV